MLNNYSDMKYYKIKEAKTSKKQEIIDFIRHLISIDIEPAIIDSMTNRRWITLDWDELSDLQQTEIERLSHFEAKHLYRVEPNGAKKKALIFV